MSLRNILLVLGVISLLSLVGAVAGSGLSLTGQSGNSGQNTASVAGQATSTSRGATPGAAPLAPTPNVTASPTPRSTPQATPISPKLLTTVQSPLVLLNPASARPGSSVAITGSGFDPGTTVDITLKRKPDDQGQSLGFVQVDKSGSFGGFSFTLPQDYGSGPFIVVATQHSGGKQGQATGHIAANSPQVTLGTQVGKPGDQIAFSLKGFASQETVKIYFNSLNSTPLETVNTDQSGSVRQDSMLVPFGAIGNNAFIFIGQKSQSPVTVGFLMLNLYPSVSVNTYATRDDSTITFSGKGFGPNERVIIHLNSVQSPPIAIALANAQGGFSNGAAFTIPFGVQGKSTFIAVGEQSQAPATVNVDILPYTPYAEASTYGGRPGTTVSFYGTGFAREEVIHVYVGRTQNSAGQEVSCFRANDVGDVPGEGQYTIAPNSPPGNLVFTLVGASSGGVATSKMQVMAPDQGLKLSATAPTPAPFHCSLDNQKATPLPTPTPVPAPSPGPNSVNPQPDANSNP